MFAYRRSALLVLLLTAACQQPQRAPVVATEAHDADACAYARRPLSEVAATLARNPAATPDQSTEAYLAAKQQVARTPKDLVAAIEADAQSDDAGVAKAGNALAILTRCRQDQINGTAASLQRGSTSAEAARAQYRRIAAAVEADSKIMAEVVEQATARTRLYLRARAAALGEPEPNDDGRPRARLGIYVAKSAANIRAQPSIGAPVVGRLAAGQTIGVTGESVDGKWYAVEHRNGISYIARPLLAPTSAAEARRRAAPRNPAETFAATAKDAAERLQRFRALGADIEARVAGLGAPASG
jgi:hypothetical protein